MNANETAFEKLITVQRMTRAYRHAYRQTRHPAMDVSRGQGRVLSLLKLRDGLATKEMAEILGIRVSSLNETLARMERDGLVRREPSEHDRRIQTIGLTEAGSALESPRARLAAKTFAGFSDAELETFGGFLERVADNLESELGDDYREFLRRGKARRKEFFGEAGPGCHGPHHGGKRGGPKPERRDRGPRGAGPRDFEERHAHPDF